ncbi:MAG: PPC domain-containing protein [Planctomycetia bacterium]
MTRHARWSCDRTWLAMLLAAVFATTAARCQAQLPAARLDAIFPPGAAAGRSVDVTLVGADLDDLEGLVFSHPGITAVVKKAEPGPFDQGPQPIENAFVVTVAADVPPGHYAARCRGRYGLSNARTFVIDTLEHAVESEPNDTVEDATPIPVPGIVAGTFSGGADRDCFRFAAKRGQKLTIECLAGRIDSRAKPVVRLLGPEGTVIDEARAASADEACLDLEVPADGDYRLVVSDAVYGNGNDFVYAIRVSSAPRLAFVWPPVVAAGATVDAVAYGWNLPGGRPSAAAAPGRRLEELAVRLAMPGDIADRIVFGERLEPWQFGLDGVEFRVDGPGGRSNPVFVVAADGPTVTEAADNDTPAAAMPLTLPADVVGRFHPRRDADWYRFDAKAGDVLWIEASSHRLGAPTDPSLVLEQVTRNEDGSERVTTVATVDDTAAARIGGREFDQRSHDPAYRFTAPADGTYRLLVRDAASQQRTDPGLVYRLVVRPPRPDFRLVAVPFDASGAILLRKGGRAAIEVIADRRDGFDADIALAVEGLPAGVTAGEVMLGAGSQVTAAVLSAGEAAAPGSGTVRIVGRAKTPAGELVRRARLGIALDPLPFAQPSPQNASSRARLTDALPVTVSADEVAPVALSIGAGTVIETSRGGVIKIPYTVVRKEGAQAALTGFALGLPPTVNLQQVAIGTANAGEFELRLPATVPPGTYSFLLTATQQGLSYARNPAAAAAAKTRAEQFTAVLADTQAKAQAAQQAAQKAAAAVSGAAAGDEAAKAAAATAKQSADQAAADAQKRLQQAQAEKQRLDQRSQQIQQQAAVKGVNVLVPSTPVTLKIAEHPLRVSGVPETVAGTAGMPLAIPFMIERLFGFTGDVAVKCSPPAGTMGFPEATVSLPANQTAGTLMVPLAPNAAAGTHECKLTFTITFNGQQLTAPASIKATVAAAPPKAAP